jgi:hypothetical protein
MSTKHFLYLNEFGDALLVAHEGDDTLTTLQTLVEGWVQPVPTNETETGFAGDVWVNEEGLFQPTFTLNLLASAFAGQRLVGPAVIARFSNETGETLGLTKANLTAITRKGLHIDDNDGEGWTPADAAAVRQRIVAA